MAVPAAQLGSMLEDKVILITGAGSGIGKATALLAASAGATVVATDLKGHDETAAAIGEAGGKAEAYSLDVTDEGSWNLVVEDVLSSHGRIDGLANIAGIVTDRDSLLTQDLQGWDLIMGVDLKGPWLGMKTVVPHMLNNAGGKVVNVASVAGLIGMPNVLAYSTAKGGVVAMSRQVAMEYADQGLRVNVIAPGVISTPMLGNITEELLAGAKAATPTKSVGQPEDIGAMIVYLLGAGSDFITGQVMAIDGGWTAQ